MFLSQIYPFILLISFFKAQPLLLSAFSLAAAAQLGFIARA
jgi:hypothetical protein